MDALLVIQAAAAMDEGLVSPAPLVIDPFPCAQGSQRVTDATTLPKAQKNPRTHRPHVPAGSSATHRTPTPSAGSWSGTQKSHAEL